MQMASWVGSFAAEGRGVAGLELVEGAWATVGTLVEDVGVDHRGLEVTVAKQFLDGADVGAVFEQVCGEGVPEGVAGGALVDSRAEEAGAKPGARYDGSGVGRG